MNFGAEYAFNSASTSYIQCCTVDSTHVLVAYRDVGNTNYGTAVIATKNFHVSTRTAPLLAGGSDRWENVSFTLTQQTTD